jgi:hypothetical protein
LKLFQELGERGIKENDGGDKFEYAILYKYHNILPPSTERENKIVLVSLRELQEEGEGKKMLREWKILK